VSAPCPEFGFRLTLRLTPGVDAASRRALSDALRAVVEARGLSAAGGGEEAPRYLVTRDGGQAIDADREALREWAAAQAAIARADVGPLVDLREAAV
jgi:uncharacterized protein YggL (DUF469 family)